MIQRHNVMGLLLEVCTSFKEKWKEHLQDSLDRREEYTILYTDFSEFARHLAELVKDNNFEEFQDIFDKVEYLLQDGDPFVQEAIVVGLLEDFQNGLLRDGCNFNIIEKYLKPETKKYWIKVIKFWNGEIPYIDDIDLKYGGNLLYI